MTVKVVVQPSGHEFGVEEGESILDAGLRNGFALPYGCRNGACGSCKGKLLSGEVDYPAGLPDGITADEAASGQALFCQARPKGDIAIEVREVGAAKDIPVKTLPCRVAIKKQLNHDVVLLELKLPATERLQFLAGQYLDFLLKGGKRRSFSIANAPHDDEFIELHIRHVDGGKFTSEVFDSIKEKDIMRIEGPLGSFFLREESDRPIIFMAGGTGFAPIKGMIEHALAAGMQRNMHLFWGARRREDLYMHEYAQQLADQHSHIEYTPVLSEPAPGDNWNGEVGYVHEAIVRAYPDLSGYEIYASGPPVMVYAGHDAFRECGLTEEHYFSDAFEFARD